MVSGLSATPPAWHSEAICLWRCPPAHTGAGQCGTARHQKVPLMASSLCALPSIPSPSSTNPYQRADWWRKTRLSSHAFTQQSQFLVCQIGEWGGVRGCLGRGAATANVPEWTQHVWVSRYTQSKPAQMTCTRNICTPLSSVGISGGESSQKGAGVENW